ncbi:AAA family ATPase [Altererythrobacter aquiaggeris]|uniref:AAA family ATPase n=1 Tax=Aestuarierythrobacter aquiaggeris TaxID=1898396 RepID=UPI003016884B
MGRENTPMDLQTDNILRLPAPLTVIADALQIEALQSAQGISWISDADLVALPLDQPVPDDALPAAGIVVLQVDPDMPASMARLARIRATHPRLAQIVALDNTDLRLVRTLIREGVADVVSLPLDPDEILQAAIAVLEVRAGYDEPEGDLAPLIAVTRSLGGSGATTLLTHLAREFVDVETPHANVCIIDLDIQFGRVSDVLGLQPRRNLTDLLDAGVRIDSSLIRTVAVEHETGIAVVAAPQEIVPIEAIDTEQLMRVIETARRDFEYVFLDLPSNLTNWNLSVLAEADRILMVVEQTIPSLRQARRRLDLFRNVGIESRSVSVIVNRAEKKLFGGISLADVKSTLDRDVLAALSADAQYITTAQDQGLLVDQIRPKSKFAADIDELAEKLAGLLQQRSSL